MAVNASPSKISRAASHSRLLISLSSATVDGSELASHASCPSRLPIRVLRLRNRQPICDREEPGAEFPRWPIPPDLPIRDNERLLNQILRIMLRPHPSHQKMHERRLKPPHQLPKTRLASPVRHAPRQRLRRRFSPTVARRHRGLGFTAWCWGAKKRHGRSATGQSVSAPKVSPSATTNATQRYPRSRQSSAASAAPPCPAASG